MQDIKKVIENHKIICSCRGIFGNDLFLAMNSLYEGGIRILDIAFQQDNESTIQQAINDIKHANDLFDGKLFIGMGNVLSMEQMEYAIEANVKYIISPISDKAIIDCAKAHNIFTITGAMTSCEIYQANQWGTDMVMIYPAGYLGPKYIGYMVNKGPLNYIDTVACGGVNKDNIKSLLYADCKAAVVGQYLADKELVRKHEFDKLKQKTETFLSLIS